MSNKVLYLSLDHDLVSSDPIFLKELASFYCNIWRFDPRFKEFKKCPVCERYYGQDYVVDQGHTTCPDCQVELIEAWVEKNVENTIWDLTNLGQDFFGMVACDWPNKKIIGFVWGLNKPLSEVKPAEVLSAVKNSTGFVPYFNEIATDPEYRGLGIGSKLCRMLVEWMKEVSPNTPGYLHTQEKSPARKLFEKAGYRFLCYDQKLGGGRIYMSIDKCANFTPENLRSPAFE